MSSVVQVKWRTMGWLAHTHTAGKGVVVAIDYREEWHEHERGIETGSGGTDGVRTLEEFVGI